MPDKNSTPQKHRIFSRSRQRKDGRDNRQGCCIGIQIFLAQMARSVGHMHLICGFNKLSGLPGSSQDVYRRLNKIMKLSDPKFMASTED
jgi:hypothetical protein